MESRSRRGYYGVVLVGGLGGEMVVLDRRPTSPSALNQAQRRCDAGDSYAVVEAATKVEAQDSAYEGRAQGWW